MASNVLSHVQSQEGNTARTVDTEFVLRDVENMLDDIDRNKGILMDQLNLDELRQVANDLFRASDSSAGLIFWQIDSWPVDLPLDRLGLLFAALALHNLSCPDDRVATALFDTSTRITNEYAGESTIDLVLTLFIQHMYVLRTGTANRSRGLLAQSVQTAHDLGIHLGSYDNPSRSLWLYLILCFADQYCALTHNTLPLINATALPSNLFDSLIEQHPRVRRLIQLILLNGQILQSFYTQAQDYEDVVRLESAMGHVCASIGRPASSDWLNDSRSEVWYEGLVQIHVFWLIITSTLHGHESHAKSLWREKVKLPPTWRQVRRITTSMFIIFLAFWKGEVAYDEACRSYAMAIFLLEFQRTRWGSNMDDAISSLRSLASLSGFQLQPFMEQLIPEANDEYLTVITGTSPSTYNAEQWNSHNMPDDILPGEEEPNTSSVPSQWWEHGNLDTFLGTAPAYNYLNFDLWDMANEYTW
ncbi:hypothetical protein LTR99_003106 [Exophiala xenobiotica]|uniref:Transcription factor domain-containing protein n=1 Tax=Vermiconidia calcicola TaxID=1690605 RepID=A0AAV9QCH8_9PEZI|nr:hypothetical protein LTR92_005847 [Exophiala xenobiotica]KAK5531628.1 hypothetical protein LTR23_009905 [Chaetothyriales sp. CCFEE 6169]KAK5538772.1 hypothetical protein LTR25_004316 [Vermiconidia calcicola]KAK5212690.1 hypothetical protein LTR41_001636 [Exophiala xenobiotica]KAK5221870.1 hypothetical protein LTR72_006125 [Exophiala xenobiotica]